MLASPVLPERLDFELPDFLRLAWVSDGAREIWADRFHRIIQAWADLEWLSVASQLRNCALMRASRQSDEALAHRVETYGLKAAPLYESGASNGSHGAVPTKRTYPVMVGAPRFITALEEALRIEDHETIGTMLGYPSCCRKAFTERCLQQKFFDPTWLMAAETAHVQSAVTSIEVNEEPMANMLLRWIGMRAIPHLPCSFNCPLSIQWGRRFLELGRESGFRDEMEWLEHILSWPIEWSGLHGIAEIKTPVLKISTKTDATARKLVVRWRGSQYPESGAQGVSFPYRTPARPLTTGSPSFQRALQQITGIVQIQPLGK